MSYFAFWLDSVVTDKRGFIDLNSFKLPISNWTLHSSSPSPTCLSEPLWEGIPSFPRVFQNFPSVLPGSGNEVLAIIARTSAENSSPQGKNAPISSSSHGHKWRTGRILTRWDWKVLRWKTAACSWCIHEGYDRKLKGDGEDVREGLHTSNWE